MPKPQQPQDPDSQLARLLAGRIHATPVAARQILIEAGAWPNDFDVAPDIATGGSWVVARTARGVAILEGLVSRGHAEVPKGLSRSTTARQMPATRPH